MANPGISDTIEDEDAIRIDPTTINVESDQPNAGVAIIFGIDWDYLN